MLTFHRGTWKAVTSGRAGSAFSCPLVHWGAGTVSGCKKSCPPPSSSLAGLPPVWPHPCGSRAWERPVGRSTAVADATWPRRSLRRRPSCSLTVVLWVLADRDANRRPPLMDCWAPLRCEDHHRRPGRTIRFRQWPPPPTCPTVFRDSNPAAAPPANAARRIAVPMKKRWSAP